MKRHKAALLIVVLLGLLTLGAWQLSNVHSVTGTYTSAVGDSSSQPSSPSVTIDLPLRIHHSVTGMTHTYMGTVTLPNICDTISNGISTQESHPPQVTLMLSVHEAHCPTSTKTPTDFSVSVQSKDATPVIHAVTFNGMEVPYTLVETN